jgi:hypothetical protein
MLFTVQLLVVAAVVHVTSGARKCKPESYENRTVVTV